MKNENNYIEDLKNYKKEFNDYLIQVKNEMMNYNESLDSSPWLTLGVRSSKLFNLIEKIKICENKIQEELEDDIISKNYELINNIPKEKSSFIEILNKVNLFRNEQESKSFTEIIESIKDKYVESEKENPLEIQRIQREEKVNMELNSLVKYKTIKDAKKELINLENNGKYNYLIFQNTKESYYIVANSIFWEHLSRMSEYEEVSNIDE